MATAAALTVAAMACGWAMTWMAQRVQRAEGVERWRGVSGRLAELTDAMRGVQSQLAAPAGTQQAAGQAHVSQATQGRRVGIMAPTVDGAATVDAVQRAREAGIEEGFEIGYRARLSDHNVRHLPRRRSPRLTGDS